MQVAGCTCRCLLINPSSCSFQSSHDTIDESASTSRTLLFLRAAWCWHSYLAFGSAWSSVLLNPFQNLPTPVNCQAPGSRCVLASHFANRRIRRPDDPVSHPPGAAGQSAQLTAASTTTTALSGLRRHAVWWYQGADILESFSRSSLNIRAASVSDSCRSGATPSAYARKLQASGR